MNRDPADCEGIHYAPIESACGQPHPILTFACDDVDGVWRGDVGNISVLYGPGRFVANVSDAGAYYGERNFWPWNVHGPLVHVPAGDVDAA